MMLLTSLLEGYNTVIVMLEMKIENLTSDDVKARLLQEEARRNETSNDTSALISRDHGKKGKKNVKSARYKDKATEKVIKCYHCGKNGHKKSECWTLQKEEREAGGAAKAEAKSKTDNGKSAMFSASAGGNGDRINMDSDVLSSTRAVINPADFTTNHAHLSKDHTPSNPRRGSAPAHISTAHENRECLPNAGYISNSSSSRAITRNIPLSGSEAIFSNNRTLQANKMTDREGPKAMSTVDLTERIPNKTLKTSFSNHMSVDTSAAYIGKATTSAGRTIDHWFIDSGATQHMSSIRELFKDY